MPQVRKPRAGSMQFWPRVRARREYTRIRSWPKSKDAKPLGFAGYKVGMTHLMVTDNNPNSLTKNADIFCPVTVVECPPLKAISMRFYKNNVDCLKAVSETFAENADKELMRKILLPKKAKKEFQGEFDEIRLLVHTQPKLTGIGKKKPEVFEVAIGGGKEQQLKYAKEKLGKEVHIDEIFREGEQLDIHAVTKGKGFQGPVKRFGVHLRSHKSEKSVRNPGSLGAWRGQGHMMYRVAHAGKMGYHTRTEYNKQVIKIGKKGEDINVKGGYIRYGTVRNPYVLIKGSIAGSAKRMVRLSAATRANKNITQEAPKVQYVSLDSKQGN